MQNKCHNIPAWFSAVSQVSPSVVNMRLSSPTIKGELWSISRTYFYSAFVCVPVAWSVLSVGFILLWGQHYFCVLKSGVWSFVLCLLFLKIAAGFSLNARALVRFTVSHEGTMRWALGTQQVSAVLPAHDSELTQGQQQSAGAASLAPSFTALLPNP